jgi:hypothetical protein
VVCDHTGFPLWVSDVRPGSTVDLTADRELRRANDLLKRASAFFAAELDRPSR